MTGAGSRDALVLLNPAAGGGRCAQRVRPALDALRTDGWLLEVIETTHPGDARAHAQTAARAGQRRILVAGGDGTAWEVVSGLMDQRADVRSGPVPWLGFLPGGTGNSFLRDFGDGRLATSLLAIRSGRERAVDVGCLHTDGDPVWSLNLLSIGFVADICATANLRYKRLGELSYVCGLLHELARLRPMRLRMALDNGPWVEHELTFLSLNNSRYTGGAMLMAPDASVDDGLVDVVRVAPFGRLALLGVFPRIFRGTHVADPRVAVERCARVRLALPSPVPIMVDGEVLRARPTAYETHPLALRVAV